MRRLLCAIFVLSAFPALAWESTCHVFENPHDSAEALSRASRIKCEPAAGPNTARNRWIGPLDEHRRLWEEARVRGGLPAELSQPVTLDVFTPATPVQVGKQQLPSLIPAPFLEASRQQLRTVTLGELAQLPDYSYALWDWAAGHETCPLPGVGVDAERCHDFATHMGPVNSNHFVPQAQHFYARYHELALARAADCKRLHDRLGGNATRFLPYVKACELQALALEAVGQHYLQDAWSSGHMWERWGAPELSAFDGADPVRKRESAVLVALVSGMIHGSRGVLQALPEWTTYDVNDAMCAPHDDVHFVTRDGALGLGVGDAYLGELASLTLQSERFFSCSISGMRQVYEATARAHGAIAAGMGGWQSVDPLGPGCFGQRATNRAILTGMGIQMRLAGQQLQLPLDGRTVGFLVPKVAQESGDVEVAPQLRNRFRLQLMRMVSVARLVTKDEPAGTQLATGRLGSFLGAAPNGAYTDGASYLEPSLPWPDTPDRSSPETLFRAASLARLFHRAHAGDYCRLTTAGELSALRQRAQDTSLDAETQATACSACTEFAGRHLRVGSTSAWDTTREPLCSVLNPSAPVVYQSGAPSDPVESLARTWCGC